MICMCCNLAGEARAWVDGCETLLCQAPLCRCPGATVDCHAHAGVICENIATDELGFCRPCLAAVRGEAGRCACAGSASHCPVGHPPDQCGRHTGAPGDGVGRVCAMCRHQRGRGSRLQQAFAFWEQARANNRRLHAEVLLVLNRKHKKLICGVWHSIGYFSICQCFGCDIERSRRVVGSHWQHIELYLCFWRAVGNPADTTMSYLSLP